MSQEGAQRGLLLLCLSISESWILLVQRKLHLGSRGLSEREVAERGHFSKLDLVCFRKFSSASTGQHFHHLSTSQSVLCQKEPDSGSWHLGYHPFCPHPHHPTQEPPHFPSWLLSPPSWPRLPCWPSSLTSACLPSPHSRPSLPSPTAPTPIFLSHSFGLTPSS